jgi:hypothetical protein
LRSEAFLFLDTHQLPPSVSLWVRSGFPAEAGDCASMGFHPYICMHIYILCWVKSLN